MPHPVGRLFRVVVISLLTIVVLLLGVLAGRALTLPSRQITSTVSLVSVDASRVAGRISEAIRFRTISTEDGSMDKSEFLRLHQWLSTSYPRIHSTCQRETIGEFSLLYSCPGSDRSLAPVLLLGHMDVVPIAPNSESSWKHPPFEGIIEGGEVWGRGAFDDKASIIAQMEALESMLEHGFRPRRSIYLAFGHDEELGGEAGARQIAELLTQRGIKAELVLDEGGAVSRGLVPGVPGTVATVAIAEKGFVDVELTATGTGGHSSAPAPMTAIGSLSRAVSRIDSNPMPAQLVPPVRATLEYVAPEVSFLQRMVLGNLWITAPLVRSFMQGTPAGNAQVRTTCVATILHAGSKSNVIPATAQAVINCRLLPGDSIAAVVEHIQRVVADPNVRATVRGKGREPSPVSPTTSPGAQLLQKTLAEVFPGTAFAPMMTTGGTDARHYTGLTDSVYRFVPITATPETLHLIHGTNERVSVEECKRAVVFYAQLLTNLCR